MSVHGCLTIPCPVCHPQSVTTPMTAAVPEPTLEGKIAEAVKTLIAELPLDSTGHVTNCGYDDDALSGCDCYGLPGRLAAVLAPFVVEVRERAVEEARARDKATGWDEAHREFCPWVPGFTGCQMHENPFRTVRAGGRP